MEFVQWLKGPSGLVVVACAVFIFLYFLFCTIEHHALKNKVARATVVKVGTLVILGLIGVLLASPFLWFIAVVRETKRQWRKGIDSHHINTINKGKK